MFFLEFHKVQYSDLLFSSFTFVIYSWNMTQENLLVMQMIPPLKLMDKASMK